MSAAAAGDVPVVQWLLQSGARIDLRCALGASALDYAREAEADRAAISGASDTNGSSSGGEQSDSVTQLLLQACVAAGLKLSPAPASVLAEIGQRRRTREAQQSRAKQRSSLSASASPVATTAQRSPLPPSPAPFHTPLSAATAAAAIAGMASPATPAVPAGGGTPLGSVTPSPLSTPVPRHRAAAGVLGLVSSVETVGEEDDDDSDDEQKRRQEQSQYQLNGSIISSSPPTERASTFLGARVTPEGLRTLSMLTSSDETFLGMFSPVAALAASAAASGTGGAAAAASPSASAGLSSRATTSSTSSHAAGASSAASNESTMASTAAVPPGPRRPRSSHRAAVNGTEGVHASGNQAAVASLDWNAATAATADAAINSSDANSGNGSGFVVRDYFARSVPPPSTPPRSNSKASAATQSSPPAPQHSPRSKREPLLLPTMAVATTGAPSSSAATRSTAAPTSHPGMRSSPAGSGPPTPTRQAAAAGTTTKPLYSPNPWKLFGPMRSIAPPKHASPAARAAAQQRQQQQQQQQQQPQRSPGASGNATPTKAVGGSGTSTPLPQGSPLRGKARSQPAAVGPSAAATADALASASASAAATAAAAVHARTHSGGSSEHPSPSLGFGGGKLRTHTGSSNSAALLALGPAFTDALQHTPSKIRHSHSRSGSSPPPVRRGGSAGAAAITAQEMKELSAAVSSSSSTSSAAASLSSSLTASSSARSLGTSAGAAAAALGVNLNLGVGQGLGFAHHHAHSPSSSSTRGIGGGGPSSSSGSGGGVTEYESPMSPLSPMSLEAVLARNAATAAASGAPGSPSRSNSSSRSSGSTTPTHATAAAASAAGGPSASINVPTSAWRIGSGLGMALRAHQPLSQQQRLAAQQQAVATGSSSTALTRSASSDRNSSSSGNNVAVDRSSSSSSNSSSNNTGEHAASSSLTSDVLSVRAAIEAMISPTERLGADVAFRNALLLTLPYFTAAPSAFAAPVTGDTASCAPVPSLPVSTPPCAGQGVLVVAELLLDHLFRPSPAAVTEACAIPAGGGGAVGAVHSPKHAKTPSSPSNAATAAASAAALTSWRASKLRIFSVLKHWIKTYPQDFLLRVQPPPSPSRLAPQTTLAANLSCSVASSFGQSVESSPPAATMTTSVAPSDGSSAAQPQTVEVRPTCTLAEHVHARLALFPPASWPPPHGQGLSKLAGIACAQLEALFMQQQLTPQQLRQQQQQQQPQSKSAMVSRNSPASKLLRPVLLTSLHMVSRHVRARAFDAARGGREKLLLQGTVDDDGATQGSSSSSSNLEAMLQNLHVWTLHRLRDVRSERELLKQQRAAPGASEEEEATTTAATTDAHDEHGGGGPLGRNQMKISNIVSLWVCTSLLTAGLTAEQVYPRPTSSSAVASAEIDALPIAPPTTDEPPPLLSPSLTAARASVYRRVVSLAVRAALPPYHNWNLFFELLNALQVHAVHRLLRRGIEPALTSAEKAALPALFAITSGRDNYRAYRHLFAGGSGGVALSTASSDAEDSFFSSHQQLPATDSFSFNSGGGGSALAWSNDGINVPNLATLTHWLECVSSSDGGSLSSSRSFNGSSGNSAASGATSPISASQPGSGGATTITGIKVPYLGVLFKDLTSLEDGQPPLVHAAGSSLGPSSSSNSAWWASASHEVHVRQINVPKARALANMVFDALACKQLPTFPGTRGDAENEDDDEDEGDGTPSICPYPLASPEVQRALQESLEHCMSEAELNALSERIQPRRVPVLHRHASASSVSTSAASSAASSKRNSVSAAAGSNALPPVPMQPLYAQQRPSSSSSISTNSSSILSAKSASARGSISSSVLSRSNSSSVVGGGAGGATSTTAGSTPFSASPSASHSGSARGGSSLSVLVSAGSQGSSSSSNSAAAALLFEQTQEVSPQHPHSSRSKHHHVPLLLSGVSAEVDALPSLQSGARVVPQPMMMLPAGPSLVVPLASSPLSSTSSNGSSAEPSPLPTLRGELLDWATSPTAATGAAAAANASAAAASPSAVAAASRR